jgi:hypothetical protein
MGMSSYDCLVCGRDMMSEWSYKGTPEWMTDVVVFMPDDVMIAGKFTGYQAVETEETIWSKYVDRNRHESEDRCEGISIIMPKGIPYDESQDEDHGYMNMWLWEDSRNTPCCYHRACWEAVGSPMGFHGPSPVSHDQGFGSGNALYKSGGFEGLGDEDDEFWAPPLPENAMKWWAATAVGHFLYNINSLAGAMAAAEEKRELFRSFAEIDELIKKSDALIEKHD